MDELHHWQIRDDAKNGFHVENLTDEYVTTVEDVTQIIVKVFFWYIFLMGPLYYGIRLA